MGSGAERHLGWFGRRWRSGAPATVAGARCYDLFYAEHGKTPFCRWAAANGAKAVSDGLGMLVEQAAEAFHLWRKVRPGTADVLAALLRERATG